MATHTGAHAVQPFLVPLRRIACVVGVVSVVASCNLPYELSSACSDELRSAVRVDVVDSTTGLPAAGGAIVWLRSSTFIDSVIVPDTVTIATAQYWMEDRVKAGTYSVEVRRPPYRVWLRDGIKIEANRCHVTTFAFITARLQR